MYYFLKNKANIFTAQPLKLPKTKQIKATEIKVETIEESGFCPKQRYKKNPPY